MIVNKLVIGVEATSNSQPSLLAVGNENWCCEGM